MNKNSAINNLFGCLFFAALVFIFFSDVLASGEVLLTRMTDSHLSDYSFAAFSKAMWQQGVCPLWNPLVFCGTPLGADSYPNLGLLPFVAFWLKDLNLAWNVLVFLKVFLAGFCTFLYVVGLGLHPASGLLAGMIVAFAPASGTYSSAIDSWIFCLPLALWFIERYFAEKKARFLVFIFFDFGLLFLNAMPQHSLYMGIFFALYVLFRFRSFLGVWILILAAGAISFHLTRLLELLKLSPRGHLWLVNVLLPSHLFNFIFPFIFEAPFRPETNFFFTKAFLVASQKLFHKENMSLLTAPYFGIVGFTFAVFARRGRGPKRFYLGAAAAILFFTMTFPIFAPIYKHIPILSQLFRLGRLDVVFTFILAILAGIGFDRMLETKISMRHLAIFYAAVLSLVIGMLLSLRFLVFSHEAFIRRILTEFIEKKIYGSQQFKAPLDFYLKRIDEFLFLLRQWTDPLSPAVFLPIVLIVAILALLFLWKRGKMRRVFFIGGCLGLLFFDLFTFANLSTLKKGSNATELTSSSGLIRYLKTAAKSDLFRTVTILEESSYGGARERDLFAPHLNMIYGLNSAEGYNPLFPKTYSIFVKNFQTDPEIDPGMILFGPEDGFDYAVADFLNVKYFVTKKGQKLRRVMPVAYEDSRNVLYLNPTCYPRAFLIRDYVVSRDQEETLSILRKRKADLERFAVLEDHPVMLGDDSGDAARGDSVEIEKYMPDHIRMKVLAAREGILILTDNYFPGWIASIDGKATKILKADLSFRAVSVPQGSHVVDFSYKPESFRLGLLLSIIFLFLGVSILAYGFIFHKSQW